MFRKVTAAMAAAVMMMTNVMFPITAFAGEENVQAASDGSEKTEAEAAFFHVYIPYFNEMDVKYDSQKLKETRQDGSSVLQAMAGEGIDLTLTVNEHYGLDQIKEFRKAVLWCRNCTFVGNIKGILYRSVLYFGPADIKS